MSAHPFPSGMYPILDLDACQKHGLDPLQLARSFQGLGWFPYQLRAKGLDDRSYLELAEELHNGCSGPSGHPAIIGNDFLDVVWHNSRLFCGIHLGQMDLQDLKPRQKEMLIQIRQNGGICGCSTHNETQFAEALLENIGLARWSYVALGPVVSTESKTNSADQNRQLGVEETVRLLKWEQGGHPMGEDPLFPALVLIGGLNASLWSELHQALLAEIPPERDKNGNRILQAMVPAAIGSVVTEEGRKAWTKVLGRN